ncbi:hypothetical protein KW842_07195 [Duganella sp. sic0402]|uniref:hypothetical protein n=1 Tax=Duganella sp. sic0402 TaxID=2854786 RepID=UPI001C44D495|nr:hypothetical protein [Duganella sp. sic0402]MBV7535546.1 hypothetical protein [Duganella sp. sic0402]
MKQKNMLRMGAHAAAGVILGAVCLLPCRAAGAGACSSELGQPLLKLEAKTANPPDSNGGFINRIASCNMWQNFFYLNWPALAGQAGVPNAKAVFGLPGDTVWQTFASPDQVFLANGKQPSPWGKWTVDADLPQAIAGEVRAGKLRVLRQVVKLGGDKAKLHDILQVDELVLYDQQTNPVYYEVMLNKTLYDYIVSNRLYEAAAQASYAAKKAIAPPEGSFELKAAWKVLTDREVASKRFFTARAYVIPPGGGGSVQTVGLVGLHIFAGGGSGTQGNSAGLWGTFAQVDNAPLQGQAQPSATYSFYNPALNAIPNTPVKVGGKQVPAVTQVTQVWADDTDAATVTAYAQSLVVAGNKNAPWQYYKLINTQWPRGAYSATPPVPQSAPLPLTSSAGAPNAMQLLNPVLETYMQVTQAQSAAQRSCMACHAYAQVADKNLKYATGFSFLFGRAQAAPSAKAQPSR